MGVTPGRSGRPPRSAPGSFSLPLQDIPEEGTPLRCPFPSDQAQQLPQPATKCGGGDGGSGGRGGMEPAPARSGSAAAAKQAAPAQQADTGDVESAEKGGGGSSSWLSRRLRWPVVPIYSDVGTGSWREATWHFVAMTAAPAAWVTGPYALSRLTWAGVPLLALAFLNHYYCAMLMAELHTWNVVIRHTRYRDLAKSIWGLFIDYLKWSAGLKGFHLVFVLQNFGSLLGAIPIVLSVAIVLKDLHGQFNPGSNVPIAWWLLVVGVIELALSQVPSMHHFRHLNAIAVVMTAVWTIMVAVTCFRTGQVDRDAGTKVSYALAAGSPGTKALGVFEALGIFSYSLANMLLPEIQSIVKPPAVSNGRKGFTAAFAYIGIVYPVICFAGYWAFGNAVNPVFTLSLPDSRGWITVTMQLLLVTQACINYQLWARPTFEVLEYLLMDYFTTEEINLMSPSNCVARLGGTGVFVLATCYLAGFLPIALGDWSNIIGVLCYVPLNLVLPMLMWNTVQHPSRWRRITHILLSGMWCLVSIAAVTAAVYHLATADILHHFWEDVQV